MCVGVDLSSGMGGPFPILELTKACWTYPPPKEVDYKKQTKLRPTQFRPSTGTHHDTKYCE
jgi:hypothetical protein